MSRPVDVREYLPSHLFPTLEMKLSNLSLSTPLDKLRVYLRDYSQCTIRDCTLTLEYIDNTGICLSDLMKRISLHIRSPLPNGTKIYRKMALQRILDLEVVKTFTFTTTSGKVSLTL